MTRKQKLFADFFILYGNATRAAKEAGYSQKDAKRQGTRLTTNVHIKSYIDAEMKKKDSNTIASADEVLKFLTDTMNGKYKEEVVVVESIGDFCSKAITKKKAIQPKDRLKAAELLGKRHFLWDGDNNTNKDKVIIEDDIEKAIKENKDD